FSKCRKSDAYATTKKIEVAALRFVDDCSVFLFEHGRKFRFGRARAGALAQIHHPGPDVNHSGWAKRTAPFRANEGPGRGNQLHLYHLPIDLPFNSREPGATANGTGPIAGQRNLADLDHHRSREGHS